MGDGLGVMINKLFGSSKNPSDYYGRRIKTAVLKDDEIKIRFDDGKRIKIWDSGQSCCETRYMKCDDELSELNGQKLVKIVVKEVDSKPGEHDDTHEVCFLEIVGNKSSVTVSTHNEHNGYYGGFCLSVDEMKS